MGAPSKVQVAADHTLAKVLLEPSSRATNGVLVGAPSCWNACVGSVSCWRTSGRFLHAIFSSSITTADRFLGFPEWLSRIQICHLGFLQSHTGQKSSPRLGYGSGVEIYKYGKKPEILIYSHKRLMLPVGFEAENLMFQLPLRYCLLPKARVSSTIHKKGNLN